ncbi:hypothetical protein AQJ91_23430 [Streptomyces dysideae]|uniref:Uncharacterized protein n=1 Tax=Streptomyces dysideae TaxID=909626 RepID=A0A117RZU3_9ACTN|nr:hypothetical protein AQJ91_23430 [Streptomyces dysideae]
MGSVCQLVRAHDVLITNSLIVFASSLVFELFAEFRGLSGVVFALVLSECQCRPPLHQGVAAA